MRLTASHLKWLVGNPDAYAVQKEDGSWYPARESYPKGPLLPLTREVLQAHLAQEVTVGTYLLVGDTARTLVLDFDSGEEAAAQASAALDALRELGFPPRSLGLEFSGNKGWHTWLVMSSLVPAKDLRRVGRAALALAGVTGEVYPKQDRAVDLGNLIKLPGGVHQVTGNRNLFSGAAPQPLSVAVLERVLKQLPEEPQVRVSESRSPLECVTNICEGVSEGGRNHAMFQLAVFLFKTGLPRTLVEDNVFNVNRLNNPPLDDSEVAALLRSAQNSGPVCNALPDELRCAECPIYRERGLSCRPGQVRHAGEGELVVVKVGSKDGGLVKFEHPDIERSLVRLS